MRRAVLSSIALFVIALTAPAQEPIFPLELYPVGNNALDLQLADLDGDGQLEALMAVGSSDSVDIFFPSEVGGFLPGPSVPVGDKPVDLVIGDLNQDGVLDLLTVNKKSQDVSVRLGLGDGTFTAGPSVPVPGSNKALSLTLGDFDGDGLPDLAVGTNATFFVDSIWTWLGMGDGTFLPPLNWSGGGPGAVMVSGDVNGDGLDDLAIAHSTLTGISSSGVGLLLSLGQGGFDNPVKVGGFQGRLDVALADLNLDGDLDIVTADKANQTASVFLGFGNGKFDSGTQHAVGQKPRTVVVNDRDDDGWPDVLVTCNSPGEVAVLKGTGAGMLGPATLVAAPLNTSSLAVGKWDGDGVRDLLILTNGQFPALTTLLTRTDGSTPAMQVLGINSDTTRLALGSLKGDGAKDIAVAWQYSCYDEGCDSDSSAGTDLYTGAGDGSFSLTSKLGMQANELLLADLNADGVDDLVGFNGSSVMVSLSDPVGRFKVDNSYWIGSTLEAVAAGDLDGDGDVDLAAVRTSYSSDDVVLLFARDVGDFGNPIYVKTASSAKHIALGDLDDDGHLDIVVSHDNWNSLSLHFGLGDGAFGPAIPLDAGNKPTRALIVDFDRDGQLDIAVANRFSDTATVLIGRGNGRFEPSVTYTLIGTPSWDVRLDAGLLDEDPILDLVAMASGPDIVTVLQGVGDGSFASPRWFSTTEAGIEMALGDINGDTRPDLVLLAIPAGRALIILNQLGPWSDLGLGLSSSVQAPMLTGQGALTPNDTMGLLLTQATPNTALTLVVGVSAALLPFKGGVLVPQPSLLLAGELTNAQGKFLVEGDWPRDVPSGFELYAQAWLVDGSAAHGFAATNAVVGMAP